MRIVWTISLFALAGCFSLPTKSEDPTQQVPASPFAQPRQPAPTRVSYAPASQETTYRVLLLKDQLIGKNPQIGLKPFAIAIGSADPELFHVGKTIYITEGLVRQCGTDNALAAALAYEMGRMVSEREATVAAEVRQPERMPPINLPIGNAASSRDANPFALAEAATYEKQRPRPQATLPPPNPEYVARTILDKAGYQRTDLDAVLPALTNAARYATMENQFKGNPKDSQWKAP